MMMNAKYECVILLNEIIDGRFDWVIRMLINLEDQQAQLKAKFEVSFLHL